MGLHVVFGAGPIGRGTAAKLAQQDHRVVLVSRSGTGPEVAGAERAAADAGSADEVQQITRGATAIYNCLNPAYHRWPADWPPMAAALLAAAEANGSLLATMSNLYAYGPVTGPITEDLPLRPAGRKGAVRASMFHEAWEAHQDGRIRMVELRASDYVGPGTESHIGRVLPRLLSGRSVSVIGDPDQPHTWTYSEDVTTLMAAVASDPSCWGRAWHVPSGEPRTQRQAITDAAVAAEVSAPRVRAIPAPVLRALGLVNPTIRELAETRYQFTRPFVMDSTQAQRHFGLAPTPWADVIAATVADVAAEVPVG